MFEDLKGAATYSSFGRTEVICQLHLRETTLPEINIRRDQRFASYHESCSRRFTSILRNQLIEELQMGGRNFYQRMTNISRGKQARQTLHLRSTRQQC